MLRKYHGLFYHEVIQLKVHIYLNNSVCRHSRSSDPVPKPEFLYVSMPGNMRNIKERCCSKIVAVAHLL